MCSGGENGNPLQYPYLKKSHRQRSLVGCSPKGHKESNTTQQLNTQHRECVMVDFLQQNSPQPSFLFASQADLGF